MIPLKRLARDLRRQVNKVLYAGSKRYCPICRSHVRCFRRAGAAGRENAKCPVCRGLERHRLVWIFLHERTRFFEPTPWQVLHVAPERAFSYHFRRLEHLDYLTADIAGTDVHVNLDITDIPFEEERFDIVLCSHVLEHVSDDRKAMREIFRVLRAGGWAVLNSPVTVARTIEDPTITDPRERERLFGQHDHVRAYGPDYADRLREAGFALEILTPEMLVEEAMLERWGLVHCEPIYYCAKLDGNA